MSAYHVRLVHTLRMVGVATVMADAEAAALAQMQQRATEGRLGRVEWRIAEDQSGVEEWYEHEVQFTIDTVTEDEREPVADMCGGVCPLPCTAASRPAYRYGCPPSHHRTSQCPGRPNRGVNDPSWLGVPLGERRLCMVREDIAEYDIGRTLRGERCHRMQPNNMHIPYGPDPCGALRVHYGGIISLMRHGAWSSC